MVTGVTATCWLIIIVIIIIIIIIIIIMHTYFGKC
jgi:hypothetical protein